MIDILDEGSYFVKELGPLRISVNEDNITTGKIRQIAQKVTAVKRAHIKGLKEFPFNKGESVADWEKRTQADREKLDADELLRKRREDHADGTEDWESDEDYLDRYMDCTPSSLALYKDLLNLCLQEFGDRRPVSDEEFEDLPLDKTIQFIKEVLAKARINVEAVFPRVRW